MNTDFNQIDLEYITFNQKLSKVSMLISVIPACISLSLFKPVYEQTNGQVWTFSFLAVPALFYLMWHLVRVRGQSAIKRNRESILLKILFAGNVLVSFSMLLTYFFLLIYSCNQGIV